MSVTHPVIYLFPVLDGLVGAQLSVEGMVLLELCPEVNMSEINSAQDCIQAAANPDIVASLEQTVTYWCKQIEQVLLVLILLQSGYSPLILDFHWTYYPFNIPTYNMK